MLFQVKPLDPDLPLTVIVAVPALLDPGELMLGVSISAFASADAASRYGVPDRIGGPAKAERTAVCVCLAVECVRAALVPSAARDLPAFYISLRKLGSLRVRQGCDRDQPVEHVTQILAGDEMVAPAVQLLAGRRSIGPLRWRGHPHSFAVHRAV